MWTSSRLIRVTRRPRRPPAWSRVAVTLLHSAMCGGFAAENVASLLEGPGQVHDCRLEISLAQLGRHQVPRPAPVSGLWTNTRRTLTPHSYQPAPPVPVVAVHRRSALRTWSPSLQLDSTSVRPKLSRAMVDPGSSENRYRQAR